MINGISHQHVLSYNPNIMPGACFVCQKECPRPEEIRTGAFFLKYLLIYGEQAECSPAFVITLSARKIQSLCALPGDPGSWRTQSQESG